MRVKELIKLLQTLDPDMFIFTAIGDTNGEVGIEEVTESNEDPTVIGYMITDDPGEETTH